MPSFNPDPFKPGEIPSRIGAERAAITMRGRASHSEEDSNTHGWTAVHVLEAYARGDLVPVPTAPPAITKVKRGKPSA